LTQSDATTQHMEQLVLPICDELGLDLYDLEIVPGADAARVRVTVDRAGASGPGTGVTVQELARVTRALDYALEAESEEPHSYALEVSSPGIERTLRRVPHYQKAQGQEVRLVLHGEVEGVVVVEGTVVSVADGPEASVCVRVQDREINVPISRVKRGRTVFDFSKYDRREKPGASASGAKKRSKKQSKKKRT